MVTFKTDNMAFRKKAPSDSKLVGIRGSYVAFRGYGFEKSAKKANYIYIAVAFEPSYVNEILADARKKSASQMKSKPLVWMKLNPSLSPDAGRI